MVRRAWFERRFDLGMPPEAHPDIVERLRGSPLRLEERTAELTRAVLGRRSGEAWSIAEHAGHLSDLEPLWLGRVEDLAAGLSRLRPADLQNRATWDANHNARPLDEILGEFADRRAELVRRLEAMTEEDLRVTALHPRLEQPMTAVDLAFFVAEHDDHHLATITSLRRGV